VDTRDVNSSESLPEWVDQESANTNIRPRECLERYDYLKQDFLTAIRRTAEYKRRAAAAARGGAFVEVVFSLAGELLDWAEGLIDRLSEPQLAYAAVRSAQPCGEKGIAPETHNRPVSRVSKNAGEYAVEVATYRQRDLTEVEVEVLRQVDKTRVRPFAVEVLDPEGRLISPTVHIGPGQLAHRFGGPAPGVYLFKVSWEGSSTEIPIEFK